MLTFGKYKGKTIREVSNISPSYIIWLSENTNVPIDKNILEECENRIPKKAKSFSSRDDYDYDGLDYDSY